MICELLEGKKNEAIPELYQDLGILSLMELRFE